MFVGARLGQGLGAALMLPAALSTLTTTFTADRDHHRALGIWGAVAGLASAAGILLVFALVQAPIQGWGARATWLEFAGAAALLATFVATERSVRDPILPLSTFRIRGLVAANLTALVGFAGMLTMFFFLTLYMQTVLGYSPVAAGAAYLPLTLAVGVSSGIGAKLLTKIGSRAVICAGALIASAGLLLLAQVPVHGSYLANILPGLMLFALGVGPVFVGVTAAANAGAEAHRAGLVAAILNSAQQVGGALGLAIFSVLATSRTAHLLATGVGAHAAATAGFHRALLAGAVFAAAAALISLRTANTHQDPMEAGHAGPTRDTAIPHATTNPCAVSCGA